jgi:conjugal transfer pilus assembly protein TraK
MIDPISATSWGGALLCAASSFINRRTRALRFGGVSLLAAGFVLSNVANADQYKVAADNAQVACVVSKRDVTRISLVGDGFASLNKVATGVPYNDFAVVNEPVRGDIYLSISDGYASKSVNFFATTKKGYVYKFTCQVAAVEAQQVFVTNPALATARAHDWESETPPQETAVRLIQAMATSATVDGYEVRQPDSKPSMVGNLQVRLLAEYRGAALLGKIIRIENRGAAPVVLKEGDVAPEGTLAVTITEPKLAPGAATTAYLVGQNGAR